MIATFYDKNLKKLQNNTSLIIDEETYSLIKRPIELNEFYCQCQGYTADIDPMFVVVSNDLGKYVYGSLAGVPVLTDENKTEINGTDLKTMLSSDIFLNYGQNTYVKSVIEYIFDEWNKQINKHSVNEVGSVFEDIACELRFVDYSSYGDEYNIDNIKLNYFKPESGLNKYNALEEMQAYLKAYNLYLNTYIDFSTSIYEEGHFTWKGKIIFEVGRLMLDKKNQNIKLWEYGYNNYGKWVADINETIGYYKDSNATGSLWKLDKDSKIKKITNLTGDFPYEDLKSDLLSASLTKYGVMDIFHIPQTIMDKKDISIIEVSNTFVQYSGNYENDLIHNDKVQVGYYVTSLIKDNFIYPAKRKIVEVNDYNLINIEPIKELSNCRFNEDIEIEISNINPPSFETLFSIYIQQGKGLYKTLPCGELIYNSSGLKSVQIGFRYTTIDFI